jgi:hypothetical protein
MNSSPSPTFRLLLIFASFALLPSLGLLGQEGTADVPLKNSGFADTNADGLPDDWKAYPGPNGTTRAIEPQATGGTKLVDTDPKGGVGISQWVPVVAGKKYQADVTLEGAGGCFVYLVFVPKIPGKDGQIGETKLLEQRNWMAASEGKGSVAAMAPAGSTHALVWIYSPKDNQTCQVVLKNATVTDLGGTPIVESAPEKTPPSPAAAAVPAQAQAAPVLDVPAGSSNLLANAHFKDANADGQPDDWKSYPGANGTSREISMSAEGNATIKDEDKEGGVGLAQWVDVTPGAKYEAGVSLGGQGGLFLYLLFAPEIPSKDGLIEKTKLSETREFVSAGHTKKIAAVAPAGATKALVWLYSPKTGTCHVTVHSIYALQAGAAPPSTAPSASAASDAPARDKSKPAPAKGGEAWSATGSGILQVIDFESGDLSQATSREGGKKEIVDDPVRAGKHALKVHLTHDQKRTEVTGLRSGPYGEYKYGWSIYIPKDFDADHWFSIITQWHDYGSGKEYQEDGGPPTHLYISKGGTWRFKVRYQDGETAKTANQQFSLGSIDPDRGKWTDFVMEVNWQSPKSGDGYLRLYKNGEKVIDYAGPTWYEEKTSGPYFKMGIYKGKTGWKGDENGAVLYFDEFRFGDRTITMDDINPAKKRG